MKVTFLIPDHQIIYVADNHWGSGCFIEFRKIK